MSDKMTETWSLDVKKFHKEHTFVLFIAWADFSKSFLALMLCQKMLKCH